MSLSKLPWSVKKDDVNNQNTLIFSHNNPYAIAETYGNDYSNAEVNADFIVAACNMHDELLECLKKVMKLISDGILVRDISKDINFDSYFERAMELVPILTRVNLAIYWAEKKDIKK